MADTEILYAYGNNVDSSGDYVLAPALWVAGIVGAGGGSATFEGSNVNATLSFAPTVIGLLSPYSVTSEDGAHVTLTGTDGSLVSTLTGTTITANGGTVTLAGEDAISALSGTTYNIENGGTLMINQVQGADAIAALGGSTVNFGTGGGTLVITPGSNVSILEFPSITGFDQSGATIEIPNATAIASVSQSGDSTNIVTTTGQTIQVQGDFYDYATQHNLFQSTSDGNLYISTTPVNSTGDTGVLVCFLPGSMISTPSGAVAVEDIRENDEVMALVNDRMIPRRVTWAGKAQATVRMGLPDDEAGYPVRILHNAIADGVPCKDMLITAEHCLFLDGRFIPARMLVNGRSIFHDRSITSYDYYHIETEEHSVIMADGMLTESYLDTGNRRAFQQDGHVIRIGGKICDWAHDAAAPLGISQDFVEPVFRQIEARAIAAGRENVSGAPALSDDPALYLLTETNTVIRQIRAANGFVFFMIPPGVQDVRIMSRTSRPSDIIGPYVDDRRQLGVLVKDIKLFEGNAIRAITTHLAQHTPTGWHDGVCAPHNAPCRWTDGQSPLHLGAHHAAAMRLLCIEILAGGPYAIIKNDMAATDRPRLTA
ncbi:Hint domain-containing protein [Komagataeibacter swingsii]|uniref:Hint domain-containing protein n=1 Tax=Komagataeibacter swingsii TaxID=215220 RepID=A0A850P2D6_9PROT|nr:Hint domain-containing protein [Komagataeibacter swingsii]NVN36979.1 Hint domain-containing protein [Komagataeibacter swingsii]